MIKEKIYTGSQLPSGTAFEIIEAKGWHMFQAMVKASTDKRSFLEALIVLLIRIDGKQQEYEYFDTMEFKDASYLMECLNLQIGDSLKL